MQLREAAERVITVELCPSEALWANGLLWTNTPGLHGAALLGDVSNVSMVPSEGTSATVGTSNQNITCSSDNFLSGETSKDFIFSAHAMSLERVMQHFSEPSNLQLALSLYLEQKYAKAHSTFLM